MKTLDPVDAASLRDDIPPFRAGDTVKVHVKVVEGNKTRVQVFQGVVIARSGSGASETYTGNLRRRPHTSTSASTPTREIAARTPIEW